jgi:hypothetical protein
MLQLTRRTLAAPAGLIRYLESADRHRKNTNGGPEPERRTEPGTLNRTRKPGSEPGTYFRR